MEVTAEVEGVPRRTAATVAPVAGILTALVAVVTACSLQVENGYVQSPDGALSFRHPLSWTHVELSPNSTEWVTAVDASDQPSAEHVSTFVLDQPFVVAQVFNLDDSNRDQVTMSALRTLALADRRDPTAGDDPSIRLRFQEPYLNGGGFEGHHMRFEVDMADGTAVEEQFVSLDPHRKQVQRVRVACSLRCFQTYEGDIDSIFDSVRLRS